MIDVFIHTHGSVFQRGCLSSYLAPKGLFHPVNLWVIDKIEGDSYSFKKLIKKKTENNYLKKEETASNTLKCVSINIPSFLIQKRTIGQE